MATKESGAIYPVDPVLANRQLHELRINAAVYELVKVLRVVKRIQSLFSL